MRNQEKLVNSKGCYKGPSELFLHGISINLEIYPSVSVTDFWAKVRPLFDIGIYGMDVNVVIERPDTGFAEEEPKQKLENGHRVTKQEGYWVQENFEVSIMEE